MSGELLTPGEVLALLKDSFISGVAEGHEEPTYTPREDPRHQHAAMTF